MLVVRSTDSSFTAPTPGTTYNANDIIGGDTVIYRGDSTGFNDTGLTAGTTYYYKFYSENWSYYSAGVTASATTTTPTPNITLANNGTQVTAAYVAYSTTAHVLHRFSLAVTTWQATLNTVAFTTAGSYQTADITNLKLRYSTDATLDAGDATLGTITGPAAAGAKSFTGLSQTINSGATGYFFITADIAASPTAGRTISVNAIATGDLTFAAGNKSGSTGAGGTQTIVTLPTVTSPTATSIAQTTATLGANVTSLGGAASLTARGTVWGTSASPTGNPEPEGGTGTGVFTEGRTGFSQGTKYYYRGYATSAAGTAYSSDGSFYTEPGQASSVVIDNVTATGMRISWTAGANADGAIVVMRASNSTVDDPVDGTVYTGNAAYGTTALGSSYIVHAGSGTSVTVGNLTPGNTYYVEVFAYAGTVADSGANQGINYRQTSPATANAAACPAAPVAADATSIGSSGFSANWADANGATSYRLDVSEYETFSVGGGGGLFISEVSDPSDTANAKFVELYNASGAAINFGTATWYISRQANGGSWASVQLSGTVADGDTFVIAYDTTYDSAYGESADQYHTTISGNGDDGYFLCQGGDYSSGTIIDVYGVIDQDGSGYAWEYTDSHAVRDSNIGEGNDTWTSSEWTISSAAVADMTPHSHTSSGGSTPSFVTGYEDLNVGNVVTYAVSGLDAETTYYYRVRAVNASCTSPNSNTKEVETVASVPTITLANNDAGQIGAGTVVAGTTSKVLSTFKLTVGTLATTLNQVQITTAGTYVTDDLTNLKLWYSADNAFGGDTEIKSISTPGVAGAKTFSSLSKDLAIGDHWFFVTADIASGATGGNTINVAAMANTAISVSSGTPSGSASAAGAQTILTVPVLTLPTATSIGTNTATLGATVSSLGGEAALSSRGTVYNTTGSPVTENALAQGGTTVGAFSHARSPLARGMKYYYRGYAVNSVDTAYSPQGSFYTEPRGPNGWGCYPLSPTSIRVTWSGAQSNDGVIVVMRQGAAVADFPQDGTVYTANSVFGTAGTAIGSGYVVYAGAASYVDVTGLTTETEYHVHIMAYKGTVADSGYDLGINYRQAEARTTSATTLHIPPTLNASNLVFSGFLTNGVTLSWQRGNGDAVVVAVGDNNADYDAGGSYENPDTNWSWGDEIDGGWFVVYNGVGTTVNVTGLQPANQYWAKVWEYSGSGGTENYKTDDEPFESFTTVALEPTTQATGLSFTSVGETTMTVNWTGGNGASNLVVVCAGSAVSWTPTDGTPPSGVNANYGLGTDLGSGNKLCYSGNGSSVALTGLDPETTYYVKIFEYNGADTTVNYLTSGTPLNGSQVTATPTCVPDAVNILQRSTYYTSWGSGGGIFDNGSNTNEIGQWANSGDKQSVAWRTFRTHGGGAGVPRELQPGDRFRISVWGYSPNGILGASLNDGAATGSWANRHSNTRGYIQCGNGSGDLYVTYGSGSTSAWGSGVKPWNSTVTLEFDVLSTREFTANIVGQTPKYDLAMMNSPGDTDRIDGYSIYYNDGGSDVYWKPETSVTNLGYVEFGAGNGTSTIYGKITDGTNPKCTNASPNYVKKSGSGTITLNNGGSTYTLYTDIAGGTLQIGADGALGTAPAGTSAEHIRLAGGAALVFTNSFVLNANRGITLNGNNPFLAVADGKIVTYNGVITDGSGTYGLIKNQGGELVLGGASDYDGCTYIDNGTITVSNSSALGPGPIDLGQGSGSPTYGATLKLALDGMTLANNPITIKNESSGIKIIQADVNATMSGGIAIAETSDDQFSIGVASGKLLTLSGIMSGDSGGEITKIGAGTLYMSNTANTHDKKITIQAGVLNIAHSRNLGAEPGGAYANKITLNGGTLRATASFTLSQYYSTTLGVNNGFIEVDSGVTLTYPAVISGSGAFAKTGAGILKLTGANTFTAPVTNSAGTLQIGDNGTTGSLDANIVNNAALIWHRSDDGLDYTGTISGTGTLDKKGTGMMVLRGNNSYSGATTITEGRLSITHANALGTTAGNTTVANGAQLRLGSSAGTAEPLVLNGTGYNNTGALYSPNGANTVSGTITLGSAARINSDAETLTLTGNISGAYGLTFGGSANITVNSVIGNVTAITKDGTGTLTLQSGQTHAFSGTATVSAGTMVQDALASSMAVSVSSGATLRGTGTNAAVSVTGTVDPGATAGAVGKLTGSSLTLNAGGALRVDVSNVAGTAGVNWDLFAASGNVAVGGAATIALYGNPTGWEPTAGYSWMVIDGGGTTAGEGKLSVDTNNFTAATDGGTFSVVKTGVDIYVVYCPRRPAAPVAFDAAAASVSSMTLTFTRNAQSDDVIIVSDLDGTFTEPTGAAPAVGAAFAGGTVVYKLGTSPQTHSSLAACTKYYYKVWSYKGTNYSETGLTDSDTTQAPAAPATVWASATNETDFTAQWTAATGASGYRLDVSTSATFMTGGSDSTRTNDCADVGGGTTSTYLTRIWTNNTDVVWTAYNARTDQTVNGNPSVCLRDASGSYIETPDIPAGLASLSFDVQQKFTGSGGQLTVYVNGTQVGSAFSYDTTARTATFSGINVENVTSLVISNNASARPAINNVVWTDYVPNVPSYVPGYSNLTVAGTSQLVSGLTGGVRYYFRVRTHGAGGCDSADSSTTASVLTIAYSTVALADNGTQIGAGTVLPGAASHVLYSFKLTVGTAPATLSALAVTTTGDYGAGDLSNLKLWYSANSTFGSDTAISTLDGPGAAGTKNFTGLSQNLTVGDHWFFVTADIAEGANCGKTLGLAAVTTGGLTIAGANKSGTATAGGAQTITGLEPTTHASNLAFNNIGGSQMDVSWTSGNGDRRIVVATEYDAAGLWLLNEGTGTTAANSATELNDAALVNGPTWTTRTGGYGAVDLDGTDDYLEVATGHGLLSPDITVSMWIYRHSEAAITSFASSRGNYYDGFFLFALASGNLNFDWGDGTAQWRWDTGYRPPLNQWIHIVVTRNSSGRTLYVNGNYQSSTGNAGGPPTANTKLRFGADTYANQFYHDGLISEPMILDYALTSTQVAKLYAMGSMATGWVPTDGVAPSGVDSDFSAATDQGFNSRIVYDGEGAGFTMTGLDPNTVYLLTVYEYKGSGSCVNYLTSGTPESETQATACLGEPTGLYASATNLTDFTATWSSVANATGYLLDVSTNENFGGTGGGNLMSNAGFETGDFTDWDTHQTEYSVVTTDPQEGTYHVSCSATATRDLMQQVAITGDGTTEYEVSFYYKKPSGTGNARIWATWSSGGQVSGDNLSEDTYLPAATDWTKVTYTVVPQSGANVLNFEVRTYTGASVYWDNFYVGTGGSGGDFVPGFQALPVSGTSQLVTGLTYGTTYYFRLRATNSTCTSGYSTNGVVTLPTPPPNPTVATATPDGNTLMRLAWTRNGSYNVMVVYKEDGVSTAPTQGQSYSVGGACGGGTVIYKGSAETLDHMVNSGHTHYYAFYSYTAANLYSSGLTDHDSTGTFGTGEIVDTFSYTNGTRLADHGNGSNGWSGAWSGQTTLFTNVYGSFSAQLNYPEPTGNKLFTCPAGGSVNAVNRTNSFWFQTNVYASYIMNHTWDGDNKWCGAYLMDNDTERIFFGESGGGNQRLGLFNQTHATRQILAGENNDYIVIIKYDIVNDDAWASVYKIGTDTVPTDEPGSWDMEYLNVHGGVGKWINGIRLVSGGSSGQTPGNTYFDEVRMGSSWDAVVIVDQTPPVLPGTGPFTGNAFMAVAAGGQFVDPAGGTGTNVFYQVPDNMFGAIGTSGRSGNLQNPGFDGSASGWSKTTGNNIAEWNAGAGHLAGGSAGGILINAWDNSTGAFGEYLQDVAATSGAQVAFSALMRQDKDYETTFFGLKMQFVDVNGTLLAISGANDGTQMMKSTTPVNTTTQRISVAATAPDGTDRVRVLIVMQGPPGAGTGGSQSVLANGGFDGASGTTINGWTRQNDIAWGDGNAGANAGGNGAGIKFDAYNDNGSGGFYQDVVCQAGDSVTFQARMVQNGTWSTTFFGTRLQFLDSGNNVIGGTTYSSTESVTTQSKFISVAATAPAGAVKARGIIRMEGSPGGSDRFGYADDASVSGATTDGGSVSRFGYVDNCQLTGAGEAGSGDSTLTLVFSGYDPDSGLSRGTTDNATQCNMDMTNVLHLWKLNDVGGYDGSRSSTYPNTKSSSATSAWHWTLSGADFAKILTENYCNTNLGNVYDTNGLVVATNSLYMADGREMVSNRVTLSLANAVGGGSRGWVVNQQYGYVSIVDDDVQPPSPTLLYVGTNVLNDTYSEANLKITVTDEEMTGGGVDFAYSWYDPSGIFLTNANGKSNVFEMVGNNMANVFPNFDLTNATYGSLGYDAWHDPNLFIGTNGAQMATCRVVNLTIPNLTKANIPLHEEWTLTVSAQDADNDRGSFTNVAGSGVTDPYVSQDRAVAINVPLNFYIRDDDTNAPTVSASGLTEKTDGQMRLGNWALNVNARDDGSGLARGDGTATSPSDLSPYVSLYAPSAYPVLLQEVFGNYANITNGTSGKGHNFPLTVQVPAVPYSDVVLGAHTVAVTVADFDDDRYNGELTYSIDRSIALNSNAAVFTVYDNDGVAPELITLTVDGVGGDGSSNLFAGAIAVIGVNGVTNTTSIDRFSFVVLAPFPAGTKFWFTDCGWDSSSNAPAGGWRGLGELVTPGHTNWWVAAEGDGDVGKVIELPLDKAINSSGDQVVIFQYNGDKHPSNDPVNCKFLFAINMDQELDGWDVPPFAQDNEHSSLYPGLTNGITAVSVPLKGGVANVMYTGTVSGSASYLLSEIVKSNNWQVLPEGDYNITNFNFDVTGAGLMDWEVPDISDHQMRNGGYIVTNIVRDTGSGLVATNIACGDGSTATAPYYLLYNTNGAVAVSNTFPTAYTNGYNAGLVTNVVMATGGDYNQITLGTVDFQVVVADTDDDRPGDTLYSTNVLQVRVYDDDPDGPTVAFTNIQGHGSSDYTGTGEILFYDFGTETAAPNLQPTRSAAAIASVADVSVNNGTLIGIGGVEGAAISSTSWTNTLPAYWQFAVTLQPGYSLDLQSINCRYQRSGTGPTAWSLRSSTDSFAADLTNGTLSGTTFQTLAASLASSSNSGTITYRLYGSNATANGGAWRIDNLYMTGRVYAASSSGYVATDSDLNTNGVVFWGRVQDSYSGVYGIGDTSHTNFLHWSLASPLGVASNLQRFGKGPGNGEAKAQTNMVTTNGFGYNDIVLGVYTARVRAADYDDDRFGDTLYATNEVTLTVVDDDDMPPRFSTQVGTYVSFDGKSAGSEANAVTDGDLVNGLSISNRLYDEKSGILASSVQVRIQSPDGWDSGLVDFTIRPPNGGSRTNQFLDAGTTTVFIANYDVELTNVVGGVDGRALGIWTNTFYAQDYDNDRPNDGLATNVSIVMWVKDDDKTGPRMTNVTATGVANPALIATGFEPMDGWKVNNNGNWTNVAYDGSWISTDAYTSTTDGRGPEGIDAGYHAGFNAVNDSLQLPALNQPGWLTVWARLSAAGESKWVLERNDSGTWTSLGVQSVLTTNYAMQTWLVDSTNTGVQLRLRLTEKTSGNRSIYFDDLVVTPYRPWTNVAVNVTWAQSTDMPTENSGIKEYRVVPAGTNNVPPTSSTNGSSLATATSTTFTPSKEVQGTVTGYVFAVDADEDRGPRDRAAGIAIPTIARLDITPPTVVTNLGAANDQVDDPSTQFDLSWTSNGVGPDDPDHEMHPTGVGNNILSPWQTYKIYYRPWDPTLVPTNVPGETYVWQEFVVDGDYSGPEWKSVCNTNVVADTSAGTNYNALATAGSSSIRLCDLEPGEDYVVVIVGLDRAGNEGPVGTTSWATNDTIKFVVTSAWTVAKSVAYQSFATSNLVTLTNVPASTNATALAWIAAGQKQTTTGLVGAVTKVYDLIYWDADKFQETTDADWRLVNNVKSNWFVDDGGMFRGRGAIRFYRASYKDRWRKVNPNTQLPQRPLASEEVYAVHNIVLSRDQNFVALHGVPYTNTFEAVFGSTNVFPGGTSGSPGSGATIVEFYDSGTNAIVSSLYWLRQTDGHWVRYNDSADVHSNAMPVTFFSRGFSITLPNPLPTNYITTTAYDYNDLDPVTGKPREIPAMIWSPVLQVPTNNVGFSQVISCGEQFGRVRTEIYNLAAMRLPVYAHPSEMNLVNSGFAKGDRDTGDLIYTMSTQTKHPITGTIYCDNQNKWRFVQGDAEVGSRFFRPNDIIIIISRNGGVGNSWIWNYHPTNFYRLPDKWMGH